MATVKNQYSGSGSTFTCTCASLANSASRASAVVDNTSNLAVDAVVQVAFKTGASGVSATGLIDVYVYGTVDGGTTYGDSATGSDAAITLPSPPNSALLVSLTANANATTYKSNPMAVAQAFGGVLPEKWGIIVSNLTGAALEAVGQD